MGYYDSQMEIVCKIYDLGKLMYQFTEIGPIVLLVSVLDLCAHHLIGGVLAHAVWV